MFRHSKYLLFLLLVGIWNSYLHSQTSDTILSLIQEFEYQQAIDLIEINGDKPEYWDLKASALKGLRKYSQAAETYEYLVNRDSTQIRYMVDLADCYQSLSNYSKAQNVYIRALKIAPGSLFINQELADAFYLDDNFEKAMFHYSIPYQRDSSYYLTRQIARCFDNLGKRDTAAIYYDKAVRLNPFDFQSTYRLATLYKQKEEYQNGIILTENYLKRDSANIKMLKMKGFLHFLLREYPDAITEFENSISLSDTSEFTYKYLGYCYFKQKEFEKAKDVLEIAFKKDTSNVELCYILGLSCHYSVYRKLGIEYLNRSIKLATPSPDFIAQIYKDLGDANTGIYEYEKGLEFYLKAYELTPNDTILLFKLASHYDNWMGEPEKALAFYQAFMGTQPEKKETSVIQDPTIKMALSFYEIALRRIAEIREELFWEGKAEENNFIN